MNKINKRLEEFISSNGLKLAWFATSSGLFKGYIGTIIESDNDITLDIRSCQFMSIDSIPQCEKFSVRINEVYGWGLA
ncbi:MAG: hypothetical protein AB9891_20660 [Anaerolineaceae bacterium]